MAIGNGYYWVRIKSPWASGDWEIANIEKRDAPQIPIYYIWTCGWEVPYNEDEIIEWGPKIEFPK